MKRIVYVFLSLIICFSVSVGRIFYISNNNTYLAGASQSKKTVNVAFERGTVFDTNSIPLTNAEYEYYAIVPPSAQAINATKKYLSDNDRKTLASGFPVKVKVDHSFYSSSVTLVKVPKRYNNICPHIIGYCDQNNNGVCGIEKDFNDVLKGGKTTVSYNIKADGTVINNSGEVKQQQVKKGVKLTIDKSIQTICERAANKYLEKGAIVVLENKTGKVRAIVSTPSYDNSSPQEYINSDNSPLYNRALSAYNCGSVFKVLVAAAALYYDVDLTYNCNGSLKLGDTTFNCVTPHSDVNMCDALTKSCNCYFIKLGQKIGAEKLLRFASSFGFGTKIKLTESLITSGENLPTLKSLITLPAELANFTFGQGVIMTSPLQIASVIQCVANNGKRIIPTLVEGVTDEKGNLIEEEKENLPTYLLSENQAKLLQKYLVNTVNNGTGTLAKPQKNGAGGKTATAQTGIIDENGQAIYQTWFAGFYPAKNPVYTITVLKENGSSGSEDCAPVFKFIADSICG